MAAAPKLIRILRHRLLNRVVACAVMFTVAGIHAQAQAQAQAQTQVQPQAQAPARSPGINAKVATKEIEWAELIPKSWDPAKLFRELKLDEIRGDADPRAVEAMDKMRKAFNEAPIEPALNGKNIKILGFLVPLDMTSQAVGEFLLVPFFGACIHTPPPPANQIIHVKPGEPLKGMRAMEMVWVEGILETTSSATSMGHAGYVLKNPAVSVHKR